MTMSHEPLRYAHEEGHTDVCYSSDGTKFITCGADGDIRIWSTSDSDDPVHNCVGEWALCVRQMTDNDLLVATGSNDIQILKFPDGERNGVLGRFVAPINHLAIGRNTNYIALAGDDMEVKLMDSVSKEMTIFDGLSGPCLSVALSPDGKLLAASSGDGHLRIWRVDDKLLLKEINNCFAKVNSFANAKTLCRIDFDPLDGQTLAYPSNNSIILLRTDDWSQKATLKSDVMQTAYSIVQYSPCGKFIMGASDAGDFVLWDLASELVTSTSKHSKSIAICGFMWNPTGNGQIVYTDIEGQLGIISGCIRDAATAQTADTQFENDNDIDFSSVQFEDPDKADDNNDDDDDDDNENAISVEKLKRECMGDFDSDSKLDFAPSPVPSSRPRTPEVPMQSAFQPSSTPEHLDPRYLCWNDVGIMRSYAVDNKSIEVEFHDSTFHNSMMMNNYSDYTMGSVSKAAVVVANANTINVIPLGGSSQREWSLQMENADEIVLVASSDNLICFATANYRVHCCSVFGTQRGIVAIPGPVVTMNAQKTSLLVAYHASGVRANSDQCINIQLIQFDGMSIVTREINAALGPESTLLWMGFSDCGSPAMMDSLGILSLYPGNCRTWIPFCDTTKHRASPSDGFFITAVFESYQAVGGIKCKGSIYPSFTPRPTMCELPLEPPFAEMTTEKAQMEANLFAWTNLQVGGDNVDKRIKETGLKTFALACRNNLDHRALELMELLSNPHLLTLAIKYASKLDKKRLSEKLIELATKIKGDSNDCNGSTTNTSIRSITPASESIKPINRKLTLSLTKSTPKNKSRKEILASTPEVIPETQNSDVLLTPSTIDTTNVISDDSFDINASVNPEDHKNPFLKSFKKTPTNSINSNPLSLMDKSAGINYTINDAKENKNNKVNILTEKRKQPDSSVTDNQKEKQRKLDLFMFKKHS